MFQRHKLFYLYLIKVISSIRLKKLLLFSPGCTWIKAFPIVSRRKNCEKVRSSLSFVNEKLSIQSDKYWTALFLRWSSDLVHFRDRNPPMRTGQRGTFVIELSINCPVFSLPWPNEGGKHQAKSCVENGAKIVHIWNHPHQINTLAFSSTSPLAINKFLCKSKGIPPRS